MTLKYNELLAKSSYYSEIHNYKYNKYKFINNIIVSIIFILGVISILSLYYCKNNIYIQYFSCISNILIVCGILSSVWFYHNEDVHKYSMESWERIGLMIRDFIKNKKFNNELSESTISLIIYNNYNQNKIYSKMHINTNDINYFKHNLVKPDITYLYIDDFLKEVYN